MKPTSPRDEVISRTDIVNVVSRYVTLRETGQGFKGSCPFHDDRMPSLNVFPAKGFWECFSCGRKGDVVDFLAEVEKTSSEEALASLADELGVELSPEHRSLRSLGEVRTFLADVDAELLAGLLECSGYRVVERSDDDWMSYTSISIELASPHVFTEALEGLPESERERIARAIAAHDADVPDEVGAASITFRSVPAQDLNHRQQALALLGIQRGVMIDVATGGARIATVNDHYMVRRRRLSELLTPLGLSDPTPYRDLWHWYRTWKAEDMDSWAERRKYVDDLVAPVLRQLLAGESDPIPRREPTGWERVDRAIEKARHQFAQATDPEDFQGVGLLCREILISLGQAVYDAELHESSDGTVPSGTDAARMLEAFLSTEVTGKSNENIRRHAKASLRLALELQHKRTADFRGAALCLEATVSTVNVVAILAGRRDPRRSWGAGPADDR